jgi:hypothetical protein
MRNAEVTLPIVSHKFQTNNRAYDFEILTLENFFEIFDADSKSQALAIFLPFGFCTPPNLRNARTCLESRQVSKI